MMNRIGRERGWPPSGRPEYEALRSPRGAVAAGSPEQVAEKILFEHELFANSRYVGQMSVGAVAHADVLRSIELFGTEVAPRRARRGRPPRGRAPRPSARLHQRLVQRERLARGRVPRVRTGGGRQRGGAQAGPRSRVADQLGSARRAAPATSSGATSRPAPVAATSPKPPMSDSTRRPAERQRGGQHAGLIEALGPRVREHDDVGAAKAAPAARPRPRSGRRSGRCAGGERPQGRHLHHRPPDDPQLRAVDPAPGPQQRLDPLVRAAAARRTARPGRSTAASSAGSGAAGRAVSVRERAVVDHVDLVGGDPEPLDELAAAVLGVHDDRVEPVKQPALSAGPGRVAARAAAGRAR